MQEGTIRILCMFAFFVFRRRRWGQENWNPCYRQSDGRAAPVASFAGETVFRYCRQGISKVQGPACEHGCALWTPAGVLWRGRTHLHVEVFWPFHGGGAKPPHPHRTRCSESLFGRMLRPKSDSLHLEPVLCRRRSTQENTSTCKGRAQPAHLLHNTRLVAALQAQPRRLRNPDIAAKGAWRWTESVLYYRTWVIQKSSVESRGSNLSTRLAKRSRKSCGAAHPLTEMRLLARI